MLRRALAGMAAAVMLTACGSSGTGVPKAPTLTAARACLQGIGMSVSSVPAGQLRSLTSSPDTTPVPVAELKAAQRGPAHTRMLVAYFATPEAATASANGGLTALLAPRGILETQRAASGAHRGRVLLIEYNSVSSNQAIMFKARYCTTGVPVPSPEA